MSRRLSRISLAFVILLTSEVWALGLGEIKLESALNQPLRAEIELLSATPEELAGLKITMASGDTFARYGLDRPVYLQGIVFQIRHSGRADGNVVEVRSANAITEPFVTFLVEASWARGRLLREYTILLDPPTFAPQAAAQSTPAVTAPTRSQPADSGRIERAAPVAQPQDKAPTRTSPPRVAPTTNTPAPYTPPARAPLDVNRPYDDVNPGDIVVQDNETLWGITSRVRDDGRLTMNQTMLAIFEANPEAFGGNINVLRAGARLRIPTANDVFQIGRQSALNEVQRQHAAWQPGYTYVDSSVSEPEPTTDPLYDEPVDDAVSQNDLTLVPPDEDYLDDTGTAYDDVLTDDAASREEEIEQRITDLEAADVPIQRSLIEIRDNELAALREELAQIRGEVYEPGLDDPFADGLADDAADDLLADDGVEQADDEVEATTEPEPTARPTRRAEPTLVEKILGILSGWWIWIVGVLIIVGGLLFWFMRRGGDDDDDVDSWRSIDTDDGFSPSDLSATESLRAPSHDDSIMVVEQESGLQDFDETVDAPGPGFAVESEADAPTESLEATAETARFDSLEDTFSSETAINLDQSDPIAEADFHMAYGLYDQAADLINGALTAEPERQDLLSKLCEIYFVWGNRDAFTDAAGRLKGVVGDAENAEWDKIVIMGQQIAADDALFAGAGVAAATKAIDMSFDAESEGTGALDMEFGADNDDASDVFDLGDADSANADDGEELDFAFNSAAEDAAAEVDDEFFAPEPDPEPTDFDLTAEMLASDATTEATVETPTIEQQFEGLSGTSELPSLDDTLGGAIETAGQSADQTAEINLDDLGLNLDGLDETEVASLDDLDATGELPALGDLANLSSRNPVIDPDATGEQTILSTAETGINEELDDASLLDATGVTQVLPDDFAVETLGEGDATMLAPGLGESHAELADDQETMLASLDDDDSDFDYAKTEALLPDAFTGNSSLDKTGELPAVASTNVDLDLDDLTAALQVSEFGDTVEQLRDDSTIEQPRPVMPDDDQSPTMALEPGEISDDLHDARTMTEVGTKLDLARAYVDMGDPAGARSILDEVLDEGDEAQRQQAQQLLDSLPS